MGSLKEIRSRVASVTSTQKITSAMKMVSAAKLRKAQDAILRMRPYADKLHNVLLSVGSSLGKDYPNPFVTPRKENKILIVVISSNSSLCGAFNMNVAKGVRKLVSDKYSAQNSINNLHFAVIGKKAADNLKEFKEGVVVDHSKLLDNASYDDIKAVAGELIMKYIDGEYDKIEFVYNRFKNAATQILTTETFLPLQLPEVDEDAITDYIYEPDKERLINEVIPLSLEVQFYRAIRESLAAEHGARMTAMHMATDNAGELLRKLKLEYNKARQASITNEILEIVGGAEALKG